MDRVKVLAHNLRAFREAAGIEQQVAAKEIGVTRQTLARWESGGTSPRAVDVHQLARLYRVRTIDLIGEE